MESTTSSSDQLLVRGELKKTKNKIKGLWVHVTMFLRKEMGGATTQPSRSSNFTQRSFTRTSEGQSDNLKDCSINGPHVYAKRGQISRSDDDDDPKIDPESSLPHVWGKV